MPCTKSQKQVFGIMMAIAMVYGMEVYNAVIRQGCIGYSILFIPLNEMVGLSLCVILLQALVGEPVAKYIVAKLVKGALVTTKMSLLIFSFAMAACMCPMMSLIATIVFKCSNAIGGQTLLTWVRTIGINLPMALCWQIFIAGPLVRWLFRKIYANSLEIERTSKSY